MHRPWRASQHTKRVVVLLHLWLGLTLGALWAVQGLTGAMLVFHREFDRVGLTAVHAPPRPLDELVATAARAQGGAPEAIGLYYPDRSILGVTFDDAAKGKRTVLMDAASGRIIGLRERTPRSPDGENFWRWVYNLHHSLLLGDRGEWLLGVRRQNIWHNSRRKLAEFGLRLGVDVRRRACGVASADARWSVA